MFKSLILHLLSLNLTASILLLKGNTFSLLEKIEKHSIIKNGGLDDKHLLNTSMARSYEYFTNSKSQPPLKGLNKIWNSFVKPSFMKKIFQLKNKFVSENVKFKGNDIKPDNEFLSLREEYEKDWRLDGKAREDGYKLTKPEENPYSLMVLVGAEPNFNECTGTLLTQEWVLTAAHCIFFQKDRSVIVYAGLSAGAEIEKPLNPQVQMLRGDPNHVIVHPKYSSKEDVEKDIALVKLLGKFNITEAVKATELSQKPWTKDEILNCHLTGFGIVQYNQSHRDDLKRKTNQLQITDSCKCVEDDEYKGKLLCNKPLEDFGICHGDSGGGLICDKLVGIASILLPFIDIENCIQNNGTLKCGSKDTLAVFVLTYPNLGWINSHIHRSADCHASPSLKALFWLFIFVVVASPM